MLGRHLLFQSGPPIPVGEKWTFTSDGTWIAPADGNYKITLVGAGGKGGSGCEREERYRASSGSCYVAGGSGSGGGGGAGQTVVQTHLLKRDSALTITVGQPNSNPSKVIGAVSLTANGGGTGGSARREGLRCPDMVIAGTVAANYGTGGSSGYVASSSSQSPSGGAGKVSDYGNGYGQGGRGGCGEWDNGSYQGGANGSAGVCVIEYLGRR